MRFLIVSQLFLVLAVIGLNAQDTIKQFESAPTKDAAMKIFINAVTLGDTKTVFYILGQTTDSYWNGIKQYKNQALNIAAERVIATKKKIEAVQKNKKTPEAEKKKAIEPLKKQLKNFKDIIGDLINNLTPAEALEKKYRNDKEIQQALNSQQSRWDF